MTPGCGHLLCELIDDGSCNLAIGRSRGCSPGLGSKTIAPEVFDEVRRLLAVLDSTARDQRTRTAALDLAKIIRREARSDRHVLAHARTDEPELVPALEELTRRRR